MSSDGELLVADTDNHVVRKIDKKGNITNFVGILGKKGNVDGPSETALLNYPIEMCFDSKGNLLLVEYFGTIRSISPHGVVTTIAGNITGYRDESGSIASFFHPKGITVDNNDNIYICDSSNHSIRKISQGIVTTIGHRQKILNLPSQIILMPDGDFLITNSAGGNIKRLSSSDWTVTTFSGSSGKRLEEGDLNDVYFAQPYGITVAKNGNVYLTEYYGHTVKKISRVMWEPKVQWKFPEQLRNIAKCVVCMSCFHDNVLHVLPREILYVIIDMSF